MINETGEDLWSASNISKTLSLPGLKAGIFHKSDTPFDRVDVELINFFCQS